MIRSARSGLLFDTRVRLFLLSKLHIACTSGKCQACERDKLRFRVNIVSHDNVFSPIFRAFAKDNGRILGYDNAHGVHERHYQGSVEVVPFKICLRQFVSTQR